MPLYKLVPISKNLEEDEFEIFNISIENELEEVASEDEGAYNLISLNYKEGMPLLYYTNAMFYDNTNKTLPMGMNLSSKVLVDNRRLEFSLVNKTKFRTNAYFKENDSNHPKCKDIFVYEYDVFLKGENTAIEPSEIELESLTIKELEQNEPQEMNFADHYQSYEPEEMAIGTAEVQEREDPYHDVFEETYSEGLETVKEIEEEVQQETVVEETYEDANEKIQEQIVDSVVEEPVVQKSKKLLKIQQKLEKEMEKQKKKEQKAKEKLEKKKSKK